MTRSDKFAQAELYRSEEESGEEYRIKDDSELKGRKENQEK